MEAVVCPMFVMSCTLCSFVRGCQFLFLVVGSNKQQATYLSVGVAPARRGAVALDLLAKLRREVEKERERKRRVMRERSRPIPPEQGRTQELQGTWSAVSTGQKKQLI